MAVTDEDRKIVEQMFQSMQAVASMMSLFADDAIWIERFSSTKPQTHRGISEIRTFLARLLSVIPPDGKISLDRLEQEDEVLRIEWTLSSSVLETPMKGRGLWRIHSGKIVEIDSLITEMPPMD